MSWVAIFWQLVPFIDLNSVDQYPPCIIVQFEELQVTKFLVSMEASGLPFTLLLNKVDLVPEQEVRRRVEQVRMGDIGENITLFLCTCCH